MRLKWLTVGIAAAVVAMGGTQPTTAQPELAEELNVYNWADYIDADLITEYEETYGVRINYDNYASNEEMFTRVQAGATDYDIVFPTDYMIARMIELDMLAELNHDNIPNLANIDPFNLDTWYDSGATYCVPYLWGTTGIAYHKDVDPAPTSWAALFDPEQAQMYADMGGINLLDDQRELLGAALIYLGYSVNETDPDRLAEARDTLLNVLPVVSTLNSSDYQDTLLIPREVAVSHSWDGGASYAALNTATDENPAGDWLYVVPQEGAVRWQDGMCILATSERKETAEHFINFLAEAEHASRISNFTGYLSTNAAAREFINPEVLKFAPPEDVLDKLQWLQPLDDETLRLYDQTWTEVRVGQ
jgi:spermidine/putrescine-binding protein